MKQRITAAILFLPWLLFTSLKIFCQDRLRGKTFATRSEVIAQHGMACTSHPLATQAAIEILKKGGTAIDAAIAANAVLGVVDPEMCGIGGDLFAIVYDAKTNKLYGLNASGRSPYNLTLDEFKKQDFHIFRLMGLYLYQFPVVWMAGLSCIISLENFLLQQILAPAIKLCTQWISSCR